MQLYYCTSFYKNFTQRKKEDPQLNECKLSDEDISTLTNRFKVSYLGFHDQKKQIYECVDDQVAIMFKGISESGGKNPYPKPIFKNTTDEDNIELYLKRKMNIHDVQIFTPGDEISHPDGFKLKVQKSSIDHPESGYGVFAYGSILPGTVVAFYPGTVYSPYDLTPEVIEGNEYMISRYDTIVIDGKRWAYEAETKAKTAVYMQHGTGVHIDQGVLSPYRNPFGIGQFINHPAPGDMPNVMPFTFDFPTSMPKELAPFIPNVWFKKPNFLYNRPGCLLPSVIFITTRRVEDEELLFNYRYNPEHPYPDWFQQPDLEEAQRRWKKPTLRSAFKNT
uniref:SET domain-containing protein n=1 Tax=Arcella intermedia TaxID=1963864 RepID=A0A6B2L933_9EUKA